MSEHTQKVKIDIQAETADATRKIKSLNKTINEFDKQTKKTNKSMTASTKGVKTLSLGFKQLTAHLARLVAIYGTFSLAQDTITVGANFEQSITNLGAISNVTGDELKELEDKALELGESTVFSATQVADAMTTMARAGLSASEQLGAIKPVLDLAINGMMSLDDASGVLVTALRAFGLEAKDAGHISDVLALGANSAKTNVTELGFALSKVAPVSKALGYSMEETVSVLDRLATAGRTGAEAGTQLKIVMLRLSSNGAARKAITGLGVDMYETGTKKLKPFTEQLRLIHDELAKLPEKERAVATEKIFESEALPSAEYLLSHIKNIIAGTDELSKSFGYSAKKAGEMMDTLKGSYLALLSALQTLQINIEKSLSPALRTLVEDMTEFVRNIDDKQIEAFGKSVSKLVKFVGELTHGVSIAIGMLDKAVPILHNISGEQVVLIALLLKFRKGLLALTALNPALLLIGTAIAGITYELVKNEDELNSFISTTDGATKSMGRVTEVFDDIEKKGKSFTLKDVTDETNKLSLASQSIKISIRKVSDAIKVLEDKKKKNWLGISSDEQDRLDTLNITMDVLTKSLKTAGDGTEYLRKQGVKLSVQRQKDIDDINKKASAENQLSAAAQHLTATEQTALDKSLKNWESREKKGTATLHTLQRREKAYTESMTRLAQKLADTRKKFADERLNINLSYQDRIRNLEQAGSTDYQKYNDDRTRGEEAFHKAKEALEKGQLSQAKIYFAEANKLSTQFAGQEISHMEETRVYNETSHKYEIKNIKHIDVTKKQTAQNAINYLKDAHNVALNLSKAEENQAVAKIKNEMALKRIQMTLTESEIDLQMASLKLMGDIIGKLKGVSFDEQFNRAKTQIAGIKKKIDDAFAKQQVLKINAVTNPTNLSTESKKIVDEIEHKSSKAEVKPKVKLQMHQAENTFNTFKSNTEQTGVKTNLEMSTDATAEKFNAVKAEIAKDFPTTKLELNNKDALERYAKFALKARGTITPEMRLNADKAYEKNEKLRKVLKKIITIPSRFDTVQAREDFEVFKRTAKEIIIGKMALNAREAFATDRRLVRQLSKTVTKTVVIRTVNAHQNGGIILPRFQNGGSLDNGIGHTRRTGQLSGYGGGDKIKALLEAGEFIMRKEAVRDIGVDKLYAMNSGNAIPKFQNGGFVGSNTSSNRPTVNLNLKIGDKTFATMSDESVATSLAQYLQRSEF